MKIDSNKLRLLFFLIFLHSICGAQDLKWMLGTWKETGEQNYFIKTIVIDSVYRDSFKGTRTIELHDQNHSEIITAVSGYFNTSKFSMEDVKILYKKDPKHGKWL